MVIYKTTNLLNGKIYIGKDKHNSPKYLGSGVILQQAIFKYGAQNFSKEILEKCSDEMQLNEREQYWISFYNSSTREIGYNIALGGEGGDTISNHPRRDEIATAHSHWMQENNPTRGIKYGEDIRNRNADAQRLRFENDPTSNGMLGKTHTSGAKKKMSAARQLWHRKISEEKRDAISKKISAANTGRKMSPKSDEVKKKHSLWMKENNPMRGKTHTEDARNKISAAIKDAPKTEEHKKKLSEANKGKQPSNTKIVEVDGVKYLGLSQAANRLNISVSTLRHRIRSTKYEGYLSYEQTTD